MFCRPMFTSAFSPSLDPCGCLEMKVAVSRQIDFDKVLFRLGSYINRSVYHYPPNIVYVLKHLKINVFI